MKKAEDFTELQRLEALLEIVSKDAETFAEEPIGRISRVIENMVADMREGFKRHAINEEITTKELFGDDDPM